MVARVDDHVCPECHSGKHQNCDGIAWCFKDNDEIPCICAADGSHSER